MHAKLYTLRMRTAKNSLSIAIYHVPVDGILRLTSVVNSVASTVRKPINWSR